METCISCEESKKFTLEVNGYVTKVKCAICKECVVLIEKLSDGTIELEIAEEYISPQVQLEKDD